MSKSEITVGIVIADDQEYIPMLAESEKRNGREINLFGYMGHEFLLIKDKLTIKVMTLKCGIGMVNAATAAAYLVSAGVDVMLSTGLSGGLSDVKVSGITAGTKFVEHDFDLTVLGYQPAEKPGQKYIYEADATILSLISQCCDCIPGVMVSGDSFVCSSELTERLVKTFDAVSADMESAAVASVCCRAEIPFGAVRQISDGGDESAVDSYLEQNAKAEDTLVGIVMRVIDKMFDTPELFN